MKIYTIGNIPQQDGSTLEIDVAVELINDWPSVKVTSVRRISTVLLNHGEGFPQSFPPFEDNQ